MGEQKSFFDLIKDCHSFEWQVIGESETHVLFRTRYGSWQIVPKSDALVSTHFQKLFNDSVQADYCGALNEASSLIGKAESYYRWGTILMGFGIILILGFVSAKLLNPQGISRADANFPLYLLAGMLVLGPLAYLLGRNVLGPRIAKTPLSPDRPFHREPTRLD